MAPYFCQQQLLISEIHSEEPSSLQITLAYISSIFLKGMKSSGITARLLICNMILLFKFFCLHGRSILNHCYIGYRKCKYSLKLTRQHKSRLLSPLIPKQIVQCQRSKPACLTPACAKHGTIHHPKAHTGNFWNDWGQHRYIKKAGPRVPQRTAKDGDCGGV